MRFSEFPAVIKDCECGQKHTCCIKRVLIEKGAIKEVPALLEDINNTVLAADKNTFAAAGSELISILEQSGKSVKLCLFGTNDVLIPDENAISLLTSFITADTQIIVGVGSGVINDLCKYVSFNAKLEYMIVCTAPSMDGYASSVAAMITGGMKTTFSAHTPLYIVADTDITAHAPSEMISSGIGDIAGKLSCLSDWKLSHVINNEYFCPFIYNMVKKQVDICLEAAENALKREPEAIEKLMSALITTGIAMSYCGSSRPASGCEHHLSHFFEITGIIRQEKYFPHGIDVGFSTALTAALRDYFLLRSDSMFAPHKRAAGYEDKIKQVYGCVADSVIALQKKTGLYDTKRINVVNGNINSIINIISEVPSEKEVIALINKAVFNMADFYNMYNKNKIKEAIIYAKDLKDRYTFLWLLEDCGLLEEFADKYITLH